MILPSVMFLVYMVDCDGLTYHECVAPTRELAQAEADRLSTPEVRVKRHAPASIYTYEVEEITVLTAAPIVLNGHSPACASNTLGAPRAPMCKCLD